MNTGTSLYLGITIGLLIPDLVKINLLFTCLNINHHDFFEPIHTPIGAILIASILSLFFINSKKVFMVLLIGVITHFILDFFLIHVYGGIKLLFPFSWEEWQLYIIRSDDYRITIFAILLSLIVFIYFVFIKKNGKYEMNLS